MSTGRLAAVGLPMISRAASSAGVVVNRHIEVLEDIRDVDVGRDHVSRGIWMDDGRLAFVATSRAFGVRRGRTRVRTRSGRVIGDFLIHLELRLQCLHFVVGVSARIARCAPARTRRAATPPRRHSATAR